MFDHHAKIQHWVNRLSFLLRSRAQAGFAEAGIALSAEEWALLMVIWSRGPQPMSALAQETLKDRTTVTRLVDRLVRKGLLHRRQGDDDRRVVTIADTPQGMALQEPVLAVIGRLIADSLEGIPEADQEVTLRTLRTMTTNLEARSEAEDGARG